MRTIFDENCITYTTPSDHKDLASKVINLCKNPLVRKQKVINARNAISDIKWDLMEKKYLDLIKMYIDKN